MIRLHVNFHTNTQMEGLSLHKAGLESQTSVTTPKVKYGDTDLKIISVMFYMLEFIQG